MISIQIANNTSDIALNFKQNYLNADFILMSKHHRHKKIKEYEMQRPELRVVKSSPNDNPELIAEQWLKSAEQDLQVAENLHESGYYAWSAFACQQALEKLLKAGYVLRKHKIPPHVHKLERLAAIMKIMPPTEHIYNLIEIDQCYTSTRYPGYKHNLCPKTHLESYDILRKAKATYEWLKQELQL